MMDRLGDVDAGIAPRWYIYYTCTHLIEGLPILEHNPHRPEDVLKVDIDENGEGGDDAPECARYGLMDRRREPATVFNYGQQQQGNKGNRYARRPEY